MVVTQHPSEFAARKVGSEKLHRSVHSHLRFVHGSQADPESCVLARVAMAFIALCSICAVIGAWNELKVP